MGNFLEKHFVGLCGVPLAVEIPLLLLLVGSAVMLNRELTTALTLILIAAVVSVNIPIGVMLGLHNRHKKTTKGSVNKGGGCNIH